MLPTIYELPFALFRRVKPLFDAAWFDEACHEAVYAGWQPGRIFVDHAEAPTAALMCRTYEYYVAGEIDTPLRAFLKDAPAEVGAFDQFYGYAPVGDAWKHALLADQSLVIIERQNFRWTPSGSGTTPAPDWRTGLPADARIVPLDRELAEQIDKHSSLPFISMFWGGYSRYETHGFGYALLVGDDIASTIYTIATSPRDALISVDTEEIYRRRSFAFLVGARFIAHCLEHGLLPVWDCDRDNAPSANLARKLGFVEAQPFVELAFPDRAKPTMTRGVWSRGSTREDGVTLWQQR
jgi:RimJ/RimL family protein N-acetyltransferase